jgi:hypothetical protein
VFTFHDGSSRSNCQWVINVIVIQIVFVAIFETHFCLFTPEVFLRRRLSLIDTMESGAEIMRAGDDHLQWFDRWSLFLSESSILRNQILEPRLLFLFARRENILDTLDRIWKQQFVLICLLSQENLWLLPLQQHRHSTSVMNWKWWSFKRWLNMWLHVESGSLTAHYSYTTIWGSFCWSVRSFKCDFKIWFQSQEQRRKIDARLKWNLFSLSI